MEHLGGLIHRMPQTAFVFLVGCVAISALPPLNGFVSEWLTFQAILLSPHLPHWGLKFMVPAVGALLALSAALAAACFVKAFGVTFLGRAAHRRRRQGAGDRPLFARRDVFPGRAVSRRRHSARLRHRRAGAGRQRLGRRRHAAAGRRRMAVDRADRREPQLLQRASGVRLHHAVGLDRRLRHPPPRLGRTAARAGLGLRLSRPEPGDAIYRARASPSRSAASSARPCSARARSVDMPPPGDCAPARLTVELHDLVWDAALRADRHGASDSPPTSSTTCNS